MNVSIRKTVVNYAIILLGLLIATLVLSSCEDQCETMRVYTYYEPVYQTTQQVRDAFEVTVPQEMETSGKIYIYGRYLLINEPGLGIHIFDNLDPSDPVSKSFINIPGNFDMAVKSNVLYADSYIDLLAIDISDIDNINILNRLENAFPLYNTQFGYTADAGQIITDWVEVEDIEISDNCSSVGGGGGFFPIFALEDGVAFDRTNSTASSSPGAGVQGVGGSMARFTIYQDYLYAVDLYNLNVFDITNTVLPSKENEIQIGWDIETIFPYEDKLFIGSSSGMHIFENENPIEPTFISTFAHARACDPVVVNGDYAYVTLRDGTQCDGFANQLDVVDISNIYNPVLVKTYPMQNPHGLGIDGTTLFLCEGQFGLKVFDITDVEDIDNNQIAHFTDMHAFDVIPYNEVLILIGEDGLAQYSYSNLEDITLLSTITTNSGN